MRKRALWAIVILMTAALIGIVALQVSWIRSAVELNQTDFNNKVYAALNDVSSRLSEDQIAQFTSYQQSGFRQNYFSRTQSTEPKLSILGDNPGYSLSTNMGDFIEQLGEDPCMCRNCVVERGQFYEKQRRFFTQMGSTPLEERIRLDVLNQLLEEELSDRGITAGYEYGVFSRDRNSFIITNGYYVVEDNSPALTKEGYRNLNNSDFRINLFQTSAAQSPGLLMLYFPNQNRYVWASVWKTLLAAIAFTSIILFCFGYTVSVIIRQKKVGIMKTDFINNMTHEFKTPIATISLAADSISSPKVMSDPERIKRFAGIIKQENKRMNKQVEKVLQMALLDKKDFSLRHGAVDLHEVIEQAVQNICLQVEPRGGKATTDLQATQPVIEADLTHVSNIINNLLDNANKYSPEAPVIHVTTENTANGVRVAIADNGMGMSKEARKHIFDKFYRVHTGNRHDVKGFGLGLSYVKAMMTAHEGNIDVRSELGKGSTFILYFPFRQSGE